MSMTFKAGASTIHRIIEMEVGFTPALEFLPNLTKKELDFWLDEAKKTDLPQIVDSVIPIVEAKACDVVTSDHSLNDLITLIPTPGHTIDHYAVTLGKDAV